MNIFDYLSQSQNITFKEQEFNELDALALTAFSYFPYDRLNNKKDNINAKKLNTLLDKYTPSVDASERQLNYVKLAKIIASSKRFKKAKFAFYRKLKDKVESKQFHAITIILPNYVYISFGGTDGSLTGWKEDFDMAYLDKVPSEKEAIKYANWVAKKFFFRRYIFGGHSKGGRLAITAAKDFKKTRKLKSIFSFDAPNYPSEFYDSKYALISPLIHSYAPYESIIGRLMTMDKEKTIIASDKTLLLQHDLFNWLINDKYFIVEERYSERSTRIVNLINESFLNFDNQKKQLLVEAIFDLLDKLDIETLPNETDIISFVKNRISLIMHCWKDIPKAEKESLKKIIFKIGIDYFFNRNKK